MFRPPPLPFGARAPSFGARASAPLPAPTVVVVDDKDEKEAATSTLCGVAYPGWTKALELDVRGVVLTLQDVLIVGSNEALYNDAVVTFGITWKLAGGPALTRMPKTEHVHVFDSLFFTKLYSSRNSYAAVQDWTQNVDLFAKRMLIFPVNFENSHWLTVVVRLVPNPACVSQDVQAIRWAAQLLGMDPDELLKHPSLQPPPTVEMLILDSIFSKERSEIVANALWAFLRMEWLVRHVQLRMGGSWPCRLDERVRTPCKCVMWDQPIHAVNVKIPQQSDVTSCGPRTVHNVRVIVQNAEELCDEKLTMQALDERIAGLVAGVNVDKVRHELRADVFALNEMVRRAEVQQATSNG